jgi:hypothetical protein
MEVDEGLNLNTVACLRGRLQAERQASKVAKEKAESMANKVVNIVNNINSVYLENSYHLATNAFVANPIFSCSDIGGQNSKNYKIGDKISDFKIRG